MRVKKKNQSNFVFTTCANSFYLYIGKQISQGHYVKFFPHSETSLFFITPLSSEKVKRINEIVKLK